MNGIVHIQLYIFDYGDHATNPAVFVEPLAGVAEEWSAFVCTCVQYDFMDAIAKVFEIGDFLCIVLTNS